MEFGFIFILGIVIGSFLNVCIYRIPVEESIAFPPSHCSKCKHKLSPIDLIPVISYLFLKGKCRYCKEKISIRYPLIEAFNGFLYIIVYLKFGLTIVALKYCILASILIVIGLIDYDTQFVYTNTIIFSGIIAGIFILIQGIIFKDGFMQYIYGGLIGFAIIALIVFTTKGMGEGDIEIATICGMFLGIKGILIGLFLAILLGGILGAIFMALKIKKAKEKMAFGPFIAIGSIISMIYGVELFQLYLNQFI